MISNHQNHAPLPGRVDGPGLLYGGIGLALAVAMQLVGLFKMGDARLKQSLIGSVFHGAAPDVLAMPFLVIVAAVFCFGLAFAILDSAGAWRRVILGITALVIVFAMVPTLAVWNIYFSPFLPVIALFWTWFCTMMYVNHHVMPCDSLNSKFQTPNTNVVAAAQPVVEKKIEKKIEPEVKKTQKRAAKKSVRKAAKKATRKKTKKRTKKRHKAKDPDAKYKPKE